MTSRATARPGATTRRRSAFASALKPGSETAAWTASSPVNGGRPDEGRCDSELHDQRTTPAGDPREPRRRNCRVMPETATIVRRPAVRTKVEIAVGQVTSTRLSGERTAASLNSPVPRKTTQPWRTTSLAPRRPGDRVAAVAASVPQCAPRIVATTVLPRRSGNANRKLSGGGHSGLQPRFASAPDRRSRHPRRRAASTRWRYAMRVSVACPPSAGSGLRPSQRPADVAVGLEGGELVRGGGATRTAERRPGRLPIAAEQPLRASAGRSTGRRPRRRAGGPTPGARTTRAVRARPRRSSGSSRAPPGRVGWRRHRRDRRSRSTSTAPGFQHLGIGLRSSNAARVTRQALSARAAASRPASWHVLPEPVEATSQARVDGPARQIEKGRDLAGVYRAGSGGRSRRDAPAEGHGSRPTTSDPSWGPRGRGRGIVELELGAQGLRRCPVDRTVDDDAISQGRNGRRRSKRWRLRMAARNASWAMSSAAAASWTTRYAARQADGQCERNRASRSRPIRPGRLGPRRVLRAARHPAPNIRTAKAPRSIASHTSRRSRSGTSHATSGVVGATTRTGDATTLPRTVCGQRLHGIGRRYQRRAATVALTRRISWGWDGVLARNGQVRYVTLPAGSNSVLAVVRARDGRVLHFRSFREPRRAVVAYDGTERRRLARRQDGSFSSRQPQSFEGRESGGSYCRNTQTAPDQGDLQGARHFSYDALSPDLTLYLVQHLRGQIHTRYQVRAYDLKLPTASAGRSSIRTSPTSA